MINGDLYRGAKGYAGEASIYSHEEDILNYNLGPECFIKPCEADLGMLQDTGKSDLRSVFNLALQGNEQASKALIRAAKRLGVKIAFLVNLLNPEMVVIGGGLEDAGDDFLKEINSTVNDWAFRESAEGLRIVFSQLRENSVALGAASVVIQRIFAQA